MLISDFQKMNVCPFKQFVTTATGNKYRFPSREQGEGRPFILWETQEEQEEGDAQRYAGHAAGRRPGRAAGTSRTRPWMLRGQGAPVGAPRPHV